MKLYSRLNAHDYQSLIIPTSTKSRFQLLYLIFGLNLIFFIVTYRRLILIKPTSITSHFFNNDLERNESASAICFIPRFDPWDQTISKSIRLLKLYQCPTTKHSLINVINSTQLFINQTVNRTDYSSSITHCVYLKIDRDPDEKHFRDWSYTLSEPILIINGYTDPILDIDFVLTRCYNNRTGFFHGDKFCGYKCSNETKTNRTSNNASPTTNITSLVYEYVHPLIRLKTSPYSSNNWLRKQSSNISSKILTSPPSVIMIILDAVSNLQAQRALPRTLAYLNSLGLYTFKRHAIVGDGTFENIVPMLFGKPANELLVVNQNDSRYEFTTTETEIDPRTKKSKSVKKIVYYPGPFDNYSFIIKNFSQLNYTTFFSEEWRESAFYNLKNGFRQAPTDFYLRPYWLALYETLSYNKFWGNSNPKPCYLDKLLHFLSLDWLKGFLSIHHQTPNYPTFGIMKLNEMSHDYLERLFWIDNDLEEFFKNLYQQNLLNNTILIFCGDHGHRQHRLRLTRIGSFEVKLPFFSMLLPPSFKESFPDAIQNIENNRKMLTSWWDVYETLVNILKMVEEPDQFDPLKVNWQPTTTGISLFHPIPDRTCALAGIPDKYCPCSRSISVDIKLPIVEQLSIVSIEYINNVLLKFHKHLCATLKLKTIIRAEVEELSRKTPQRNNTKNENNFTHLFVVLFEVSPSDGIFESSLLYNEKTKHIKLHSEILRINLYGQSSACIRDKYSLRSFCYCFSHHRQGKNAVSRGGRFRPRMPRTSSRKKRNTD